LIRDSARNQLINGDRASSSAEAKLLSTLDFVRFQVGDQILRVNGYPVEDAVHQEVALLAKNQQVLVLKIRSNYLAPLFIISLSQLPAPRRAARGGGGRAGARSIALLPCASRVIGEWN
jgi:hypothetical protein